MLENLLVASAQAALADLMAEDPQLLARRAQLQDHLEREAKPFDRSKTKHFTVTAVVYREDIDALLMIDHPKLHRLLFPGGHVEEADVSLVAAAVRECLEETGFDPIDTSAAIPELFDIDIHDIPANAKEPAHIHLDVRYLFRVNSLGLLTNGSWVAREEVSETLPEALARPARWLGRTSQTEKGTAMTTNVSEPKNESDFRSLPKVARLDETPPISVSDGVTLRELTGRKATGSSQTQQSSVAHFRLEPGCASAWSHNKVGEESFFVLSGSGAVWIGEHPQPLTAGSFVVIPADLVRSVRASETEALEYFALTTPAWSIEDDVLVPAPEGAQS